MNKVSIARFVKWLHTDIMKYAALDIGASGGKVLKGEIKQGRLEVEEVHRFKNSLAEKDGFLTWNLNSLFESLIEGLKKAGPIDYCAIDTWGVDFVLLDKEDKVIGEAVSYRDARTERLKVWPEQEKLYQRTGIQRQRFNTVYQLLSIKEEHPEYLEVAESLLFIPDYLSFLFTGVKNQEYTFATTTNLVDAKARSWDYDLIQSLGLPKKLFKKLSMPGSVLSKVKPEIERKIGSAPSLLLAPSHDTASAVIGAPLTPDSLFLSSGTWSLLGAVISEPILTKGAMEGNFTNEGAPEGKIRFLKNIMGTWLIQSLKEDAAFDELENEARCSKLIGLIDPTDIRFLSPPSMRDEIDSALEENGYEKPKNRGERLSVVYHSLAASYKKTVEEIEEITGRKFSHIAIVGGGSKDSYLDELAASYTGLNVTAGPAEGTALGNLLFQMQAVGECEDKNKLLKDACEIKSYKKER